MSHDDDPVQVQGVTAGHLLEETKAVGNVFERSGPTAAWISHAPVFQIPCRQALCSQSGAEAPCVGQVIPGAPEAAVQENQKRMRALTAAGDSKIAKLLRI